MLKIALETRLACVKNSENFDLFIITKVSSTYVFHKRGGSAKVSRVHVSMFSMTKFATTEETGEPIAVAKTCLQCFPQNVKLVGLAQISTPLIEIEFMTHLNTIEKLHPIHNGNRKRRMPSVFRLID